MALLRMRGFEMSENEKSISSTMVEWKPPAPNNAELAVVRAKHDFEMRTGNRPNLLVCSSEVWMELRAGLSIGVATWQNPVFMGMTVGVIPYTQKGDMTIKVGWSESS